jgi:hypothetical protein
MAIEILEDKKDYTLLKFFKTFKNICIVCRDRLKSSSGENSSGAWYSYECESCCFEVYFQSTVGQQKFASPIFRVSMLIERGTELFNKESFNLDIEVDSNLITVRRFRDKYFESDTFYIKLDDIENWLREPASVFNRIDRLITLERIYR